MRNPGDPCKVMTPIVAAYVRSVRPKPSEIETDMFKALPNRGEIARYESFHPLWLCLGVMGEIEDQILETVQSLSLCVALQKFESLFKANFIRNLYSTDKREGKDWR